MAIDWKGLKVKRVVFHQVFERKESGVPNPPSYGTVVHTLVGSTKSTIENRMLSALGNDSHGIQMSIEDLDHQGSFFGIATAMLDLKDPEFLEVSKRIADKLSKVQASRHVPGGAVIVVHGTIGNDFSNFIAVIKAEPDDGVSLADKDGKQVVDYLGNILLTKTQRLYKIGMIVEVKLDKEEIDPENFEAYIFDEKLRSETQSGAAQYFFRDFLGFEQLETAKKTTKDFYTQTKKFIQKTNLDPEKKSELMQGLNSELKVVQSATISVDGFAKTYLPPDLWDAYAELMEDAGLPKASFTKDIALIRTLLRRRRWTFPGDVMIIAPSESFGSKVKIDKDLSTAEETVLRIQGKLTGEK